MGTSGAPCSGVPGARGLSARASRPHVNLHDLPIKGETKRVPFLQSAPRARSRAPSLSPSCPARQGALRAQTPRLRSSWPCPSLRRCPRNPQDGDTVWTALAGVSPKPQGISLMAHTFGVLGGRTAAQHRGLLVTAESGRLRPGAPGTGPSLGSGLWGMQRSGPLPKRPNTGQSSSRWVGGELGTWHSHGHPASGFLSGTSVQPAGLWQGRVGSGPLSRAFWCWKLAFGGQSRSAQNGAREAAADSA